METKIYKRTEETRRRMSEAAKGHIGYGRGIPRTEEVRKKIGMAQLGAKNHMFGKKQTAESNEKRRLKLIGRKISDKQKEQIRFSKIGSKNYSWKGDKVGYLALHTWVRKNKPKSMFCEKCGQITAKLDCANISGEYKRDISDFRWLCRSCHIKEDGNINNFKQPKPNESWDNKKFK